MRTLACTQGDLPDDYAFRNSGDFVPRDLAVLTSGGDAREGALRSRGLNRGHFSLWTAIDPDNPSDTHPTVLCQAFAFMSEQQATQFVTELGSEELPLRWAAITRLPEDAEVTEIDSSPGTRHFRVSGTEDGAPLTLDVAFSTSGRFVQSVLTGRRGEGDVLPAPAILEGL